MKYLYRSQQDWDTFNQRLANILGVEYTPTPYDPIILETGGFDYGASHRGQSKTDEHKAKLAKAQTKLWQDPTYAANHANKVSKDYIVTDPQGNTYTIRNLTQHCKDHGLTRTLMLHVARGIQHHHKGWSCQFTT